MEDLTARPGGAGRGSRRRPVSGAAAPWLFQRAAAPAASLLSRPPPAPAVRHVRWWAPERPALVLGSTQPDGDADRPACEGRGIDVVRRRSGGGAVLMEPDGGLWVEVVVPAGDDVWCDDVSRAFLWLGRAWAAALGALGMDAVTVHEGRPVESEWSRRICFAGTGPGEVVLGGRKVVGISQRRTRSWALFQCAVPLAADPAGVVDVLALGTGHHQARRHVAARAGTVAGVTADRLVAALLDALPGPVEGDGRP